MRDIEGAIFDFLNRAAWAEAERVEGLCAEAMALQDFDKLDRLVVVSQDHHATAIASRWEPDAAR